MPSSISTVRWVGVPSSSMVSEPRRSNIAPSSTTVTPGAATRSPMRPEKAELPLRLKSPSKPWPIASWRRTPGQPGPQTTIIAPAVPFDHDLDVEADERAHVMGDEAVGADDLDHAPRAGERDRDLHDARI